MNECKICGKATSNKNFCSLTCYGVWQSGKTFSEQGKSQREIKHCSINGCTEKHFGRGYCRKHYIRFVLGTKKYTPKTSYKCEQCGKEFFAQMRSGHRKPRFCSFECTGLFNRKPFIIKRGYKKLLIPNHPRADGKGYVFEHIIIMEAHLGESLKPKEVIHHWDGNKLNNNINNLHVFKTHNEHMKFHARP
jgi:hypothetical protein